MYMSVWTVEWTDGKPMKKWFKGKPARTEAEKFWRYVINYHDGKKCVTLNELVEGKVNRQWKKGGG
jgi:hypothetical protein